MSYAAAAAAAGTSSQKSSTNDNNRNQNGNRSERYFNEKMIICMAHGFNTEQLADALHKSTILHAVSGLQSVDFGRRYALVVEDKIVRETLVTHGLQIEGLHVLFYFHKRRPLRRVYVSQLPIGVTIQEIGEVFKYYGHIVDIKPILKQYHGRDLDSGDRVVVYDQIFVNTILCLSERLESVCKLQRSNKHL